jgi:D-alanyl-D-alanine carboxypeptidase/D-alanyl-D-alanine-endopeptidase (penicillin-binding protein 4)
MKNQLAKNLWAFAALIIPLTSVINQTAADDTLGPKLTHIVEDAERASGFKPSELSLTVGSLWNLNGDQLMSPASLSKLITAAAALHDLHPDFTFQTLLASSAPVRSGALQGPLYLVGGGDPAFTSESLWVLVNEFRRTGIHVVDGDVVVDDSRFDDVRFTETRKSKRVDRAYDAPIGAMSFNWNSVNIYVRPGKSGQACEVVLDPEAASRIMKIHNRTRTGGLANSIEVHRESDGALALSGSLPVGHKEVTVFKNITEPDLWSGENLVSFLKDRGIRVSGRVRRGIAPADASVLALYKSKPLAQIIADMAKYSNNFVAEMLIKNLAAEKGEKPATMITGIEQAKAYLRSLSPDFSTAQFVNGSGFTDDNRFSSRQLVSLLAAAQADFTMAPEYLAALPIAGRDGTLKKRMKKSPAEGEVRAKTGMLDDTIGLAGFAHRPGADAPIPFAFIYNSSSNGSGKEEQARSFFDRLAAALAE